MAYPLLHRKIAAKSWKMALTESFLMNRVQRASHTRSATASRIRIGWKSLRPRQVYVMNSQSTDLLSSYKSSVQPCRKLLNLPKAAQVPCSGRVNTHLRTSRVNSFFIADLPSPASRLGQGERTACRAVGRRGDRRREVRGSSATRGFELKKPSPSPSPLRRARRPKRAAHFIAQTPAGACIAHAVRDCIASPDRLEKLASASGVRDKFTIEALANQLQRLGATL